MQDGRTGLDKRHLAIAERYVDQLIAPDGTMTREWVLLQLTRVAAEGERLSERPDRQPSVCACQRCDDSIADGVMCLPCARKHA